MKTYTKILVVFPPDALLDSEELINDLESQYRLAYTGLFFSEGRISLVLQTLPKSTCMKIQKVEQICKIYVQDIQALPYVCGGKTLGKALVERGQFRTWGGKRGLRENKKVSKISATKRKRNSSILYLRTNALGEEDLSHITAKHLDDLVGSEDEIVGFFERNYAPYVKRLIIAREWKKFRRYSRDKVRRWDQQSGGDECHVLGIPQREEDEDLNKEGSSSDDDEEYSQESQEHLEEHLQGPPIYDPDSDSEGNLQRKRKLLRAKLVQRAPKMRKDDFLKDIERLILESPRNSNVIASTKNGYFKYFDGERWIKAYNKDFFEKVTLARISKATDILEHNPNVTPFTRSQVSSMVRLLLKYDEGSDVDKFVRDKAAKDEAVKDGILAAENQESRLGLAERSRKRKIVRVGLDTKFKPVLGASTWEKMLSVLKK